MEEHHITKALRALASDVAGRSKISLIRTYFEDIEQARLKGVKLRTIVHTLNQHGIEISLTTLRVILSTLRKEKQGKLTAKKLPASHPNDTKSLTPSDLRKIRNQPIDLEDN